MVTMMSNDRVTHHHWSSHGGWSYAMMQICPLLSHKLQPSSDAVTRVYGWMESPAVLRSLLPSFSAITLSPQVSSNLPITITVPALCGDIITLWLTLHFCDRYCWPGMSSLSLSSGVKHPVLQERSLTSSGGWR